MNFTTDYDRTYDLLYVRPMPHIPFYADEDRNGITTLRSIEDDSAVGMVIDGFKKRFNSGMLDQNSLPFPIDVNDSKIQSYLLLNETSVL